MSNEEAWLEAEQVSAIVRKILQRYGNGERSLDPSGEVTTTGQGVFADVDEAITAARTAYGQLRQMSREGRARLIESVRAAALEKVRTLAELAVEETGLGRVEDKVMKNTLAIKKTPGPEDLETDAYSGDKGLTIEELAPYGVIGALTPVTNPSETIICNAIGMISAGNAVVFSPHPAARQVSTYTVQLLNKAIARAGGPPNLVTSLASPSMETAQAVIGDPRIDILVATGGAGVVKAVLSSGKKAIGAGAGNPPVIVDETADIPKAAKDIVSGATLDNGILCTAEKEIFALEGIADQLLHEMSQNGAYIAVGVERQRLLDLIITSKDDRKATRCTPQDAQQRYGINRKFVGKNANLILREIGVEVSDNIRLVVVETDSRHPLVFLEQLMPVIPFVRVKYVKQAIKLAVEAEQGNRHTAVIHSKNVDHMTEFAREVQATVFVKNGPSYAGLGAGGEGFATFTIAGPTGEGLTRTRTFTRRRRCVLVDGFSIV